ncbi:hypothetical protein [Nocardioides marmoribigeumensis]|uniref:Single-stranded DNA-binding protein n=1 Tax=Nocardioides marmoribigeumensis TaxID=433649 RepID=A0ABU2BYK0_9ACTN|nr:hypothetical protein [Nocardioides marmoribigeumensis]MDR7363480.1 hypothetical protein [Nocardioides marmoribigeumensis]
MTAVATRPPLVGLPEVRAHRTREGRLDYVTVQRESGGVVRVLGWFDTWSEADRSIHPGRRGAELALDVVGVVASVALRVIRPRLIH